MGWKNLFRKKASQKAIEQPLRISDGGSFLVRTGEGKTCLFLLPVWQANPADESIALFLEAAGTVEQVVVLNIHPQGYLHTLHYLSHLPENANYTLSVARPEEPWFRYGPDFDPTEAEGLILPQALPGFSRTGTLEIIFHDSRDQFVTCAYDNPAKGGKDLLLLGLSIHPDLSLLQKYQRQGLNVNMVGVLAENALANIMHELSDWVWNTCKGNLTFLFPNAVKDVKGDLLAEAFKAGGLTAASVGRQEPEE